MRTAQRRFFRLLRAGAVLLAACALNAGAGLRCAAAEGGEPSAEGVPGETGHVPAHEARVDFDRDVRPILSDKCYPCHGPDAENRKADLRLDVRESALGEREDGPAIVPGDPEASELYRRITARSRSRRMPPPRSKRELSPEEIETLRRWIAEGAEWRKHWAFEPVREPPVPPVKRAGWARHPLDRFILARLEREGLDPAPQAVRARLFRRASLDLIGLQPAIDELDRFLADPRPDAYERAVDRLLASPRLGERLAVDWLDSARFADTYGYQADRDSYCWPWRDWVIRNFNADLPYDDFITWQIAGDLLPGATREQILATTFNRLHRQTNEGGSINEEFRVEYVADRVKTMGLAFLGLTLECARCHDHKFDPITQRDFYSLFAFFNSIDESGLYSHFTDAIPSPTLLLYASEEEEERHKELKRRIAEKERELALRRRELARTRSVAVESSALVRLEGLKAHYSFDTAEGGKTPDLLGGPPASLVDAPEQVEGRRGKALLFDGENSVRISGVADFLRTDPFSFALWLEIPEEKERIVILHHSKAGSDAGSRGYELLLEDGRASFGVIHFWPGNAIRVRTREKLPLHRWVHLAVTYDGSSRAAGIRIYVDGSEAPVEIVRDHLFKDIAYSGKVPLELAARFRGPGFKGGKIDELMIFDRALTPLEVRLVHRGEKEAAAARLDASPEELVEYRFAHEDDTARRLREELRKLRKEESALVERVREIMVMRDMPAPRPTFILKRGRYDAPGDPVEPDTPAAIFPFDASLPKNRLGLARWLTDPRNPLTSRVAVNRYWQLVFGRGIVATPEDFGSQGERPTHPELLDWLAADFVRGGWDLKRLLRNLVTSAAYRQSSRATAEKAARDPENRLLSRGPSGRLSAEAIRDVALFAAGVLSERMGGPSDRGNAPPGFRPSKERPRADPESHPYRRSVYLYVKRTNTDPYLLTFDATSREACIARRAQTNTPLQALVLLNDRLFTDSACLLAERMMREGGDEPRAWLRHGFRLLASREPTARELDILVRLYEEELELFRKEKGSAEAYLDWGIYRRDPGLRRERPQELAALAVTAKALLSYDETVYKR